MSATISVITNPDDLSPVLNSPIWFRLDSASSSLTNFKYVVTLNEQNEPFGLTYTERQTYKLPPRPVTGECQYSPSKLLQSYFGYKPTPYINNWQTVDNGLIRFNIDYGFEYNPNLNFVETFNSGGLLGLSFSTAPDLQVGDTIKINKDNKQINSSYNGFATVSGTISPTEVIINKTFGVTYSGETGTITSLLRKNETSDSYDCFYGVRQYDERTRDFASEYILGLTSSEGNKFLSNYNQTYKPTFVTDYETISMILGAYGSDNITMNIETYDSSGSVLDTYTSTLTSSNDYYRLDYGIGPQNIINDTGSASYFDNVDNYKVCLTNDTSLNVSYTIGTSSTFSVVIEPEGTYNGANSYKWVDDIAAGVNKYYIWWQPAFNRWEVRSGIGTGNQYVISSSDPSFITAPPLGELGGATYSDGITPLFNTFVISSGVSSECRRYKIKDNCSIYDNVRLVFLNRLGGYDYFNFNLDSKKSLSIDRSTFRKVLDWDYNIGDRGETTFAQKGEESWTINSDWITEEESIWLEELVSSREVYHMIDNEIYPIQITNTSYQVKSKLREQIFNLSITFKYSFTKNI